MNNCWTQYLKTINANCNSPISVYAKIIDDQINIKCDLFDHNGKCLFRDTIKGSAKQYKELSIELGKKIIEHVGQQKINQLNILEDDFDHTPKAWSKKIKKKDWGFRSCCAHDSLSKIINFNIDINTNSKRIILISSQRAKIIIEKCYLRLNQPILVIGDTSSKIKRADFQNFIQS